MWNRPSRHLWMAAAVVGLLAPAWIKGQDPAPAGQAKEPQYKDPAEFTLYDSILKDTTPKTKLEKLQEWQTKYPATEFAKQRKQLFLNTYVALNQPKDAVAAAKVILADDPKDFTSLYYTMFYTRALAGNNPTPDVLEQGEKAAAAIVANIDTPPPNVTPDQWKGARPGVETLGHSTLGWIAMQRKSWDAAEGEFQKTLALDSIALKRNTSWARRSRPRRIRRKCRLRCFTSRARLLMRDLRGWPRPVGSRFWIM